MASFSQKDLPHPSFLDVSGLCGILSFPDKQVSSPEALQGGDGAFASGSQGLNPGPLWLFMAHRLPSQWQKGAAHLLPAGLGKLDCHPVKPDLQRNVCGLQCEC